MTLRDIGDWFSSLADTVKDGISIATTQSFWDWPLWLSVPLVVGVPSFALWWAAMMFNEAENAEPDPLRVTIGYGVGTALCALVAIEAWFFPGSTSDPDKPDTMLRIAYPLMTAFFGGYFLASVAKRRRKSRERNSKDS